MNRRTFVASGIALAGVALTGVTTLADKVTIKQVRASSYAPIPDVKKIPIVPNVTIREFLDAPWKYEGKQVRFGTVIVQRFNAVTGGGYELGPDKLIFRTALLVEDHSAGQILVGFSGDIKDLASTNTVIVTGQFGGEADDTDENGFHSSPTLIIASKLEDPRTATPVA